MSIFTTSDYTSEPGKDFDANVRYEPMPGDHYAEAQQGYHEETILHQMEDDEPLDYKISDANIGDIQAELIKHSDPRTSEVFGRMFRELSKLRGKLRMEKNERFKIKEKA